MTRNQKIEALALKYTMESFNCDEEHATEIEWQTRMDFKAGILAGIKLRDEELLAMEFEGQKAIDKALSEEDWVCNASFEHGAEWQHEQFMKAIKGD